MDANKRKILEDAGVLYPSVVTNANRIRAMSDKELARFLYIKTNEDGYPQFDNIPKWLDWLKQENINEST